MIVKLPGREKLHCEFPCLAKNQSIVRVKMILIKIVLDGVLIDCIKRASKLPLFIVVPRVCVCAARPLIKKKNSVPQNVTLLKPVSS